VFKLTTDFPKTGFEMTFSKFAGANSTSIRPTFV
jgi:hypothetical protein